MNRSHILHVRLDRDLVRELTALIRAARERDPRATESLVARVLLREALAARRGQPLPVEDQGFREGWLAGYAEAQRGFQTAMAGTQPFQRGRGSSEGPR